MAAAAESQLPVNGAAPLPADLEVLEYEKILRLRDEIFSGNHPRLKIPPHAIRKVTPISVHTPSLPLTQPSVDGPAPSTLAVPGLGHPNGLPQAQPHLNPYMSSSPAISRVSAPKAPSTEIDPIFLTKSDDLVRAEIQLQRQRIERTLREQLDQKRIEARQKVSLAEAKPDFDVSEVFHQALVLVKPLPASEVQGANGNTSASDSFDENSFYSSKAPDSTPRHGDDRQPSPAAEHQMLPMDLDYLDADGHLDHRVDESQPISSRTRNGLTSQGMVTSSLRPENAEYEPPQDLAPVYPSYNEPDDLEDEPEYSPPAPTIPPPGRRYSDRGPREAPQEQRRQQNRRQSDRHQTGRRNESPSTADVRIVRNHITSPIAPQPSRVSPLALAKVPPPSQNRRNRHDQNFQRHGGGPESVRTSPEISAQPLSSKKRKREARERARQNKRVAASPEPVIKDEPISPPPFRDVPPLGAVRPRQQLERPVYIDVEPAEERHYTPVPAQQYEVPPRQIVYDVDRSTMPSAARTVSRVGYRTAVRHEPDLRRLASLQHARAEAPYDYPEPLPRSVRASSYAVVERPPVQETPRYYDEPVSSYQRRYVRTDEAPASPAFRESYTAYEPEERIMAPPQHRIVMDEQGNRYYETVAQPRGPTMAPSSRRVEYEPYAEAATIRQGSIRAASVLEEVPRERRYVPEMPPPAAGYRRVTEGPRAGTTDRRLYAREELEEPPVMQRAGSVQVVDYPLQRQATYVDDRMLPRDGLVRVGSVRPGASRYDEPREGLPRVQSVRPEARDLPMYLDERTSQMREYVPMERASRGVTRQVYEDEDAPRMVLDGARDGGVRMMPRY